MPGPKRGSRTATTKSKMAKKPAAKKPATKKPTKNAMFGGNGKSKQEPKKKSGSRYG